MSNSMIVLLCCVIFVCQHCQGSSVEKATTNESGNSTEEGVYGPPQLIGWRMHHLEFYVTVTFFILVVILLKLVYHHIPKLSSFIPESCILIGIGCLFGLIIRFSAHESVMTWKLTPDLFFLLLLPPIILESSFNLYSRKFAENILSIMFFAILGTLLNFLIIGLSLWGLDRVGGLGATSLNMTVTQSLYFSSLIVAVDPVAVLSIFQDIGVDQNLYYLVFGESLFNDAITIVLYNMIQIFSLVPEVTIGSIFLGIGSFFTVSFGGFLVGAIMGVLCCLVTRFTNVSSVLEPLIIFAFGYFSFLVGDLLAWSGLMSMISCGLIQAAYAFHNISRKSNVVVHRLVGMISTMAEAIIFLFLGIELVTAKHEWHTGFSLWSLVLCILTRGLVTLTISSITNRLNFLSFHKIPTTEMFVIAYGGLRGAVAYSLATLVQRKALGTSGLSREMIITTTLFIILFTCVIMGCTIKPIIKLLKIRLQAKNKLSLIHAICNRTLTHIGYGVSGILGKDSSNSFFSWIATINDKYIRKLLLKDSQTHEEKILKVFQDINTEIHKATTQYGGAEAQKHLERLPELLQKKLMHEKLLHDSESTAHMMLLANEDTSNLRAEVFENENADIIFGNPEDEEIQHLPEPNVLVKRRKFKRSLAMDTRNSNHKSSLINLIEKAGSTPRSAGIVTPFRDTDCDFFSTMDTVMKAKEAFIKTRLRDHRAQTVGEESSRPSFKRAVSVAAPTRLETPKEKCKPRSLTVTSDIEEETET